MSEETDNRKAGSTGRDSPAFGDISEFIRTAAEHMREYGLASVDVEQHGTRIRLRANSGVAKATYASFATTAPTSGSSNSVEPAVEDGYYITAPMIGTFYAAPGPGEPDFVEPGDQIEVGQTIGVIEAMKIMNEIAADRAGVVQEVLVRNAQAVEYGQPLLRVITLDGE